MRPVQWAARLRTCARIPSQSAHIISSARGGPGTHEGDPLGGSPWAGVPTIDSVSVCSCLRACIDHCLPPSEASFPRPSSLVNLGLP